MKSNLHTLVLPSKDEARFTTYAAWADRPGGIGIVILPGVRGLLPTYVEMIDRFATDEIQAITLNHFGRTFGLRIQDEEFDYSHHRRQTLSRDTVWEEKVTQEDYESR